MAELLTAVHLSADVGHGSTCNFLAKVKGSTTHITHSHAYIQNMHLKFVCFLMPLKLQLLKSLVLTLDCLRS